MVSVDCCFIIYYIYNDNLIFNTEFNKIASKRDVQDNEKKLFRFIFIIDTIHDCMLKNSDVSEGVRGGCCAPVLLKSVTYM